MSFFSSPKAPEPIVVSTPPPTAGPAQQDATAAAQAEATRLRKNRAATGTILTGPQGLTTNAPTTKQRLGE